MYLLVLSIVSIALVSGAGWAIYTFFQSSIDLGMVGRVSAHLDAVVATLRLQTRAIDGTGVLYVPAGQATSEGWTGLPASVGMEARTPWGVSYAYCPVAPAAVTSATDTVTKSGGGTYSIETTMSAGRAYVTASGLVLDSSLSGLDVRAIITAPRPKEQTPPACDSVTWDGSSFTVPNGFVRVVTGARVGAIDGANASGVVTRHVAPAGSGTQSGLDSGNPMALTDALDAWVALAPRVMVLKLAAGTYDLTGATDLESRWTWPSRDHRLVLDGSDAGSLPRLTVTSPATLDVPVDLTMKAVGVEGVGSGTPVGLTLQANDGQQVVLEGVALDRLVMQGGTLVLRGAASTFESALTALDLSGTTLTATTGVTVTSTATPAISLVGGRAWLASAVTTDVPAGGTGVRLVQQDLVLDGGTASLFSTAGVPGSWISGTGSRVALRNVTIAVEGGTTVGMALGGGSDLVITGSTLGGAAAMPGTALYDAGGLRSVSTDATTTVYASSACGAGVGTYNAFSDPATTKSFLDSGGDTVSVDILQALVVGQDLNHVANCP